METASVVYMDREEDPISSNHSKLFSSTKSCISDFLYRTPSEDWWKWWASEPPFQTFGPAITAGRRDHPNSELGATKDKCPAKASASASARGKAEPGVKTLAKVFFMVYI